MFSLIRDNNLIKREDITNYLDLLIENILDSHPKLIQSILLVPPDITRLHSQAGFITTYLYQHLPPSIRKAVLPATGLHRHMSKEEKKIMFGDFASEMVFFTHHAQDLEANELIGKLLNHDCEKVFGDAQKKWDFLWKDIEIILNKKLSNFDLILSIGQVLPHEITGMSNYHKNILIGLGGKDFISKSHFIGALIGILQITGKPQNPVREFLKLAYDRFVRPRYHIQFLFTVIDDRKRGLSSIAGLFYGDKDDLFYQAASLSRKTNITTIPKPCDRVWVHMPGEKYHSLWLANKAIYRTLGIIKKGGKLIIDAPGLKRLGENKVMDDLISTFGYVSPNQIMERLENEFQGKEARILLDHLAVAAHLIHGYSDQETLWVENDRFVSPAKKKLYQKAGFQTLSRSKYQEEVLNTFSQDSLNALYTHREIFRNGESNHYFINDAGLGFWQVRD